MNQTAGDIAAEVRAGRRTAAEVVRAHLDRIAALDADLNAFATVRVEQALAEAAVLDARPDRDSLPLAGVPVAVKDNMAVAGSPVRHGSAATSETAAGADDELVARVRAAGAIVLGSTRMPELAAWAFTASTAYGVTRNPLDPGRDPGGSTGGGAAAVAAGLAVLALGTDGGGSIRIPSAHCGLVGLKPTRGAVPLPGGLAEHWYGLSVAGPIGRTVADVALAYGVLADVPADVTEPGSVRVATSLRSPSPLGRPDAVRRDAVEQAGQALRDRGHDVAHADPPYPATLLNVWGRSWLAGIAEEAGRLGLDPALLEPRTRTMVRKGRRGPGDAGPWTRRAQEFFTSYDVLVTPVTARGPGPAGALNGKGYLSTYLASARSVPFAQAWNLAGFPAVAVPGPGGPVQLVGPPGSEPTLLGLAAQLEKTSG